MTFWLQIKKFAGSRFLGADVWLGLEITCICNREAPPKKLVGDRPPTSPSLAEVAAAPPFLRGTIIRSAGRDE
jgi:hypothetical protein